MQSLNLYIYINIFSFINKNNNYQKPKETIADKKLDFTKYGILIIDTTFFELLFKKLLINNTKKYC